MKYCETCKWADDRGQVAGQAVCRRRPPMPVMIQDGKGGMGVIGAFPAVTLSRDGCSEHEEGREKVHVILRMPGEQDN